MNLSNRQIQKTLRALLVIALFLNPVLNQAAIAPLYNSSTSQITPAEFMQNVQQMNAEISKDNRKIPAHFQYSLIQYDKATQEMNLEETARIALQMKQEVQFDPAEYIPLNLPQQSSDSSYIAQKVARHAFENWYRDSHLKNSDIAKIADESNAGIESLHIGEKNSPVSFKVRALTGRAQVKYSGEVEATLTYEAFDNDVKLEVVRKLDTATTLVFHSIENSRGHHSEIGLRWSW